MQDLNIFINFECDACSTDSSLLIQKELEHRLKSYPEPINEDCLKEAIHYTNVALLKMLPKTAKAALSLLIIFKADPWLFIAGVGEFKVYGYDEHGFELLFQDPLNCQIEHSNDPSNRIESLKNVLGKPIIPQVMIRKIKRAHLPNLLIANRQALSEYRDPKELLLSNCPRVLFDKPKNSAILLHQNAPISYRKTIAVLGFVSCLALSLLFVNYDFYPLTPTNNLSLAINANETKSLISSQPSIQTQERIEISLSSEDSKLQMQPDHTIEQIVLKHLVKPGETLSIISQKYFGSTKYTKEIYQANKEILPSENQLKAGMILIIPQIDFATSSTKKG